MAGERVTAVSRDLIAQAVAAELNARASRCEDAHYVIGLGVADRLGFVEIGQRDTKPANAPVLHGLWVDDSPRVVLGADWQRRFRATGCTEVAVMAERSGGGLDATWTLDQLRELAATMPDTRRVLTLWPEPTVQYAAKLIRWLPQAVEALGASAVEADLEGHWKRAKVSGYASLSRAAADLMGELRTTGIPVEITTFPDHGEARASGSVEGEDRLYLQTYSVAQARGEKRDHDGRLGPERRPYEDVLQARARGAEGEVCAGLAAWAQDGWPGEPEDAMLAAYDSAMRAGVRRVRWWSSKHVCGAKRNSYSAKAIATITARAAAPA